MLVLRPCTVISGFPPLGPLAIQSITFRLYMSNISKKSDTHTSYAQIKVYLVLPLAYFILAPSQLWIYYTTIFRKCTCIFLLDTKKLQDIFLDLLAYRHKML